MLVWAYGIGSAVIVSVISLVGVFFLSVDRARLERYLLFLVSFAVGGLVGDAVIHLIPRSFEETTSDLMTSLFILAGIIGFFTLEKFIRWRHCHIPVSDEHVHPVVALTLISDGVHNLIDGMIIGASYIVSTPLGITTTLAVVLHEIPQEIGDFGVLVHGGFTPRKALISNFFSAVVCVGGVVISLAVGTHIGGYARFMLPLTAGGFLYIASADLIPQLHHDCGLSISLRQVFFIALGIALMALLVLAE